MIVFQVLFLDGGILATGYVWFWIVWQKYPSQVLVLQRFLTLKSPICINASVRLDMDNFIAAIKVLSSSGATPYSPETLQAIESKHPIAPPSVLPYVPCYQGALSVTKDEVLGMIHNFP